MCVRVCVCARMRVCARACVCVRVRVCVCVRARACVLLASVVSNTFRPHGLEPTRLLCSWDSPGKTIGVGCHALLQGVFPAQGLNLCLLSLLHCRQILYHHLGSPLLRLQKAINLLKPRADGKPQTSPGPHAFVPALTLSSPSPSTLTARTPLVLPPEQGSPHPGVTGRWQEPPPPWPQLPVTLEHPLQGAPGHPASQTRGLRVSLLPLRCARARAHSHTPTKPRCFSL